MQDLLRDFQDAVLIQRVAAAKNPATKKRTPAKRKARPPVTPRDMVNIAQTEGAALQYLKENLHFALRGLETNREEIEDRKKQQERDRKQAHHP